MSGESIQTKFTLGLLSVDPNDPANQVPWEEDTSEEVLAINQAARDAIKAKKRAKKVARQKSKESQSPSRRKKVTRQKSKEPAPTPSPDMEAKKKQEEEEEAARKRAEEEHARKAEEEEKLRKEREEEEAARKRSEEEEAARKRAEEEAARRAAEEEAAKRAAEEEAAKRAAEEEAARLAAEVVEEPEPSMTEEEEGPEPEPPKERPKLERRISFFPATGDNTGLTDAIQRYGNDVPFEWEKEEWTKEHVNLRHTSTVDRTYGWELPEWAKNNNLRKTELGEKAKQGACLHRHVQFGGVHRRGTPRRSISMAPDRGPVEITSKEIISAMPDWAKGNILKTTEMGAAARQGLNLAVPVQILKGLAEGSIGDLEFEASFADLGVAVVAGKKIIAQEKPEWSVNPTLKSSDIGAAVRQGANLALPVVEREGHLNESKEMSPNSSFAALNASLRSINKEKPAWAKFTLKKTAKGEQMKETGTLARGPTIKVVNK